MRTPDTQTVLDTHKELRELKLEINHLQAVKESVRRDLGEYESAMLALKKEFKETVGIDDLKNAVLENIITNRLKYNIEKYEKEIDRLSLLAAEKEETYKQTGLNLGKINNEYTIVSLALSDLKKELSGLRSEHKSFVEDSTKEKEKLTSSVSQLKREKEEESKKLDECRVEYLEKTTFILDEEVRLANKKSDLNIYEARLRKKYLELMPEVEIIL